MEMRYSRRRCVAEVVVLGLSLALLVRFFPLGTYGFDVLTAVICAATLIYAVTGVLSTRGVAGRWGLPLAGGSDSYSGHADVQQELSGCMTLLISLFGGMALAVLVRIIVPQPIGVTSSAGYLIWCGIQDFLFFALLLTNLEDLAGPVVALGVTALLFGLSHYPHSNLMAVTSVVGAIWGYVFLQYRSLGLITVAHWLMGLVLLG